jgi:hypothetical protein
MRQAGRYMPEYRAIRKRYTLLEICRSSELAVEVTLQPVDLLMEGLFAGHNSFRSFRLPRRFYRLGYGSFPFATRFSAL